MDLDTGLLRALVTLAEESHFGRAATRLGITQQALSKRIQRLEVHVAAPVVDRADRRNIRITAAGQQILDVARDVLPVIDRLDPDRLRPADRIRVDVMGDHLAPSNWVRRAVRTAAQPVDAVQRPADTTAEHLLRTGNAHLAFGRSGAVPSPWPSNIRRRLVLLEPLAVLVPKNHPWALYDELPLTHLAGQRLWFPMSAAPHEWRTYTAELCDLAGITLDTTGSTFGYHQWAGDVTRGDMPPSLIGEAMHTPDPRMRTVPIVDPTPVFPWSVHWRDDLPNAAVSDLLATLALGRSIPPPGPETWIPATDAAHIDPARAAPTE